MCALSVFCHSSIYCYSAMGCCINGTPRQSSYMEDEGTAVGTREMTTIRSRSTSLQAHPSRVSIASIAVVVGDNVSG